MEFRRDSGWLSLSIGGKRDDTLETADQNLIENLDLVAGCATVTLDARFPNGYAPGYGRMNSYVIGGAGSFWDGTFTNYQ